MNIERCEYDFSRKFRNGSLVKWLYRCEGNLFL